MADIHRVRGKEKKLILSGMTGDWKETGSPVCYVLSYNSHTKLSSPSLYVLPVVIDNLGSHHVTCCQKPTTNPQKTLLCQMKLWSGEFVRSITSIAISDLIITL